VVTIRGALLYAEQRRLAAFGKAAETVLVKSDWQRAGLRGVTAGVYEKV
jgi:hypothetical protein